MIEPDNYCPNCGNHTNNDDLLEWCTNCGWEKIINEYT